MKDLGLPEDMFTFINYPTRFDCREMQAALKGSGIECPNLHDYAWRLWDYWERHLDPDLFIDRSLRARWVARWCWSPAARRASAWRRPQVCRGRRRHHHLRPRRRQAEAEAVQGDPAHVRGRRLQRRCSATRSTSPTGRLRRFVKTADEKHGGVDFLINNAGRSIRRAIENSYDRFHDFERTMQLNYFGCLRVTMGLLPGMVAKRKGHVVNISSHRRADQRAALQRLRGQQGGAGRLDALRQQRVRRPGHHLHHHQHAAGAHADDRPTKIYNNVPTLAPEEAADMIAQACIFKPVRIATRLGITGQVLHALVPRVAQIVMNTSFRMFPTATRPRGRKGDKAPRPACCSCRPRRWRCSR
jgi:hypothetical protein